MIDDKTMLFDLDGSLVDYDTTMLEDIEKTLSPIEIHNLEENRVSLANLFYSYPPVEWIETRRHIISRQIGWWRSLKEKEDGFDILRMANSIGFDIHILTKASVNKPLSWMEKVEWCNEHIPYKHTKTITEDKGKVYGKVLFDDWPEYIHAWMEHRPRGLVIMPKRPVHGQKELAEHPNVILWDKSKESLNAIHRALLVAYDRRTGESVKYK